MKSNNVFVSTGPGEHRHCVLVDDANEVIIRLEREREADHKAIRALRDGWERAVNTARSNLSGVGGWDEHIANARELDQANIDHAAAIQRATEARG